jgi:hypothetical protein
MKIACSICGATAYAIPPAREGAILRRVHFAGEWVRFCGAHLPAEARSAPRVSAASPVEALAELELVVASAPRLDDDNSAAEAIEAADVWRGDIEYALAALKKSLAPREPAGKARKAKKPIALAGDDPRQTSLVEDASQEPSP